MKRPILAIAALVLVPILVAIGMFGSAYNSANQHEQGIDAAYKSSEALLGQYGQKIKEMAQVPGMQAEDLANIITAANDSRYGGDGVGGVMTWITEQNPTLDQSTYVQLQREIAAGRDAFRTSQDLVIDRVRAYKTDLGSLVTGTLMGIAGYPRITLADYGPISTQDARDAFTTKTDTAPIQLR